MRSNSIALIVVTGLLLAGHSRVVAEEPEIEGKWKVISATRYGTESKDQVGVIWEFQDDNQFAMHFANGRTLEGQYQLDSDKKPWQIDIENAGDRPRFGGGGPRKGIMTVKGHRLTLCVTGAADAPRPSEMVSASGTLNILRVMKRVEDNK